MALQEWRVGPKTAGSAVTALAVTGHTGRVVWRQFCSQPEAQFRTTDGKSGITIGGPETDHSWSGQESRNALTTDNFGCIITPRRAHGPALVNLPNKELQHWW